MFSRLGCVYTVVKAIQGGFSENIQRRLNLELLGLAYFVAVNYISWWDRRDEKEVIWQMAKVLLGVAWAHRLSCGWDKGGPLGLPENWVSDALVVWIFRGKRAFGQFCLN